MTHLALNNEIYCVNYESCFFTCSRLVSSLNFHPLVSAHGLPRIVELASTLYTSFFPPSYNRGSVWTEIGPARLENEIGVAYAPDIEREGI